MVVGDPPLSYAFGDELDVPDGDAERLIAADFVEAVEDVEPPAREIAPETTAVNRGERAVRHGRPAGR